MKAGSVKSKYILDSLRFNSDFHLTQGEVYDRLLRQKSHKTLGELTTEIFCAGRSKRIYVDKEFGIPYLGNTDISSSNPLAGCNHASKKFWNEKKGFLKEGMILTGRVGQNTVGSYSYASNYVEGCIGSDNVIRIVSNGELKSGYLFSFLASKYGYHLSRRHISGNAQPFITEEMISQLPVPLLKESKQIEIHNLISETSELRTKAIKLLSAADSLFYEFLSLDSEQIKLGTIHEEGRIQNAYSLSISKMSNWTFRARNYSPRKQKIINLLSSVSFSPLREVLKTDPHYGARYKRIEAFSSNSIELLSQGNLFELRPKGRSISKRSIKNLEQEIVSRETILVPAQGTLGENEIFGRAKFVWGYLEDKVVAGHAMRFIPDTEKIPSGYLFTVLNSSLWFRLFRNTVYGTNLLGFIVPLLNELPIPRFEKNQELEIDQMVKEAYDKLTLSNEKEAEAIELVENEIESWQKS